jgi:hypothetical protein
MSRALIVELDFEPSIEMCVQVWLVESLDKPELVVNDIRAESDIRQVQLN